MTERRIPITTPRGEFEVWTRTLGDNPDARVLLLHGGPAATHEYFESLGPALADAGLEVIYYDQLGSHHSDQPDEPSLWTLERFVDEVEQVRVALGLDRDNFIALGHSWGGLLGMEYALTHGAELKGLVISNMMASIAAYDAFARNVIMPTIDPVALARIQEIEANEDYGNPEYEALLMEHHYVHHVLRAPADEWPEPVTRSFSHINPAIYVPMQGPSELGSTPQASLYSWDRFDDLPRVDVPTLVIGAEHDTMDPEHMRAMADMLPRGEYLHCPKGSHLAMWDDPEVYVAGVVSFIRGLD